MNILVVNRSGVESIFERAKKNLSLAYFKMPNHPLEVGHLALALPANRCYVLRMMVKSPRWGFSIPAELGWVRPLFDAAYAFQVANFPDHPFAYITTRHGLVTSETDDLLHVDGFSVRKEHGPEQNYTWTGSGAPSTEFLEQGFDIPASFDPLKHNLHWYLQDHARMENLRPGKPGMIYCMDPYVAHKRPTMQEGTQRTFVRVSFVPIEIESNECSRNPAFPAVHYDNVDLRLSLSRYERRPIT